MPLAMLESVLLAIALGFLLGMGLCLLWIWRPRRPARDTGEGLLEPWPEEDDNPDATSGEVRTR